MCSVQVNAFQQEIIEKENILAQLRMELEHSQAEKIRMEERLIDKDHQIKELETELEAANSEVKTRFTQLHSLQSDNSWNFQRKEVEIKDEIGRGASGFGIERTVSWTDCSSETNSSVYSHTETCNG